MSPRQLMYISFIRNETFDLHEKIKDVEETLDFKP